MQKKPQKAKGHLLQPDKSRQTSSMEWMTRFVHRLRSVFTPEVTGLVVAMVGLSIIPVADL